MTRAKPKGRNGLGHVGWVLWRIYAIARRGQRDCDNHAGIGHLPIKTSWACRAMKRTADTKAASRWIVVVSLMVNRSDSMDSRKPEGHPTSSHLLGHRGLQVLQSPVGSIHCQEHGKAYGGTRDHSVKYSPMRNSIRSRLDKALSSGKCYRIFVAFNGTNMRLPHRSFKSDCLSCMRNCLRALRLFLFPIHLGLRVVVGSISGGICSVTQTNFPPRG